MGMERFFIHLVGRRRYIEERDSKQIRVDKGGSVIRDRKRRGGEKEIGER
jgi:hypothetical protein